VRRRVVRDLGTILGIVVILAAVVLINGYMRRGTLADQMDKIRRKAELDQQTIGTQLLPWELLRKTKGAKSSGPTFDPDLISMKDERVNLVGFMVPQYEFRQMTEFILLPLPIECYFCQAPPMREVVLVQMEKDAKVDLAREPIVVNGNLTLNEGAGAKFFYVVKNATRGAAEKGGKLTTQQVSGEHMMHGTAAKQAEEAAQEPILPGQEPPKSPSDSQTPPQAAPAPASPKP
jgi:hypothetical protein